MPNTVAEKKTIMRKLDTQRWCSRKEAVGIKYLCCEVDLKRTSAVRWKQHNEFWLETLN